MSDILYRYKQRDIKIAQKELLQIVKRLQAKYEIDFNIILTKEEKKITELKIQLT